MAKIPEDTYRGLVEIMRRFRKGSYLPFLTPEGVTPSEAAIVLGIFMEASAGTDPVQPRHLSGRMHMTPSALSQTLKVLEEKGYVERKRVSADFRAVSLELTDKGSSLADQARAMRDAHMEELVDYVGQEDMEHLVRTLNKVLDFHEMQAEAGKLERVAHPCHRP